MEIPQCIVHTYQVTCLANQVTLEKPSPRKVGMFTQDDTEQQVPLRTAVHNRGDSAPQGTSGNNWGHFSLSQLGEGVWGATGI